MALLHFGPHTEPFLKTTSPLWIKFFETPWDFHVSLLIRLEFTQQKCTVDINQMCTRVPHEHQDQ